MQTKIPEQTLLRVYLNIPPLGRACLTES